MKILHTEWSDGFGGQERRVLAELVGLAGRGHRIALVCRPAARIRAAAEQSRIPVHTLALQRSYDVASIVGLARLLRRERIDVVNTHSGIDSWIGGIAARLAGVPVLARTRHLDLPLKRSLFNFVHYLPDVYITCGETMKAKLVGGCGFPAYRVVSIPTGVEARFFDVARRPDLRATYGVAAFSPVVAQVGILRSVKGHETALRSVGALVRRFPNAGMLLVGDGPRRAQLESLTDELGIRRHVVFAGFVERVEEIYALADVSVLTSWSEGLPQSVLQSMAAGVPVVATRVGGVPEAVRDGDTGLLIEAGDSAALADAIAAIMNDPAAAQRRAANASRLVRAAHSDTRTLDQTEALYRTLLRSKGRANASS